MKNILETITKYRLGCGWTEYQLSERSGLPQSTISSWYRKNIVPSVTSLEKVCNAFGITLSQLFAEDEAAVDLTPSQRILLEKWSKLNTKQQDILLELIDNINC